MFKKVKKLRPTQLTAIFEVRTLDFTVYRAGGTSTLFPTKVETGEITIDLLY